MNAFGDSPYFRIQHPGTSLEYTIPGVPENIAIIDRAFQTTRDQILGSLEHDETGIDTARVSEFLQQFGFVTKPYVLVPEAQRQDIENLANVESAGNGTFVGAYIPGADVVLAVRDEANEAANGPAATEATLVHQQVHANRRQDTISYTFDADGIILTRLRSGFEVDDTAYPGSGSYFEDGFAGLLQHRYATEQLGLKNGLSGLSGTQTFPVGSMRYTLPRSYMTRTDRFDGIGTAGPAEHAAYGLELLIARAPAIFDALVQSRFATDGLRQFATRVNALAPGLYRNLRSRPHNAYQFIGATSLIVDKLYEGNPDLAADTVKESTVRSVAA